MCFKCGIIGHEQRGCKKEKEMSVLDGTVQRYGPFLSVPPAKEIELIMEERDRWKQRSQAQAHSNEEQSRDAPGAEGSGLSNALVVRLPEPQERHNNVVYEARAEGSSSDQNRESQFTEEEVEEDGLPQGWVTVAPEKSPSPTLRLLRETCRDSPFVPMPFSNLRMQEEYPGFRLDNGERQFGEFPLRPDSMEAEGCLLREEERKRAVLVLQAREQAVDTNLGTGKETGKRKKKKKKEREKEKEGWQELTDFDNFLIAEKRGEASVTNHWVIPGGPGSEPMNKEGSLIFKDLQCGSDSTMAGSSSDHLKCLQSSSDAKGKEKGKVGLEEYDWAKEREMNIVNYAKIKEDLENLIKD